MAQRKTEGTAEMMRPPSAATNRSWAPDVAAYLEELIRQPSVSYSADADALWSEVLARNERVVSRHAERIHPAYVEGLKALQLPPRVPRADELNDRLRATGWRVVVVDGYLPATTYASLMAESIFPVSSRIRRREQIDFAPEPDMVHDILGHLPMLFCPEHRDYLRELATYASRATPNDLDAEYHEAVRAAAELKSAPGGAAADVAAAEAALAQVYVKLAGNASQVTCLRRIYIWSIEFGLFGGDGEVSVHGAALMSAPTELSRVLSGAARLEPYSLSAIGHENEFSDLLERYFVARDYGHLHDVLSAYAASMQGSMPGTSEVRELRPQPFDAVRRSNA